MQEDTGDARPLVEIFVDSVAKHLVRILQANLCRTSTNKSDQFGIVGGKGSSAKIDSANG